MNVDDSDRGGMWKIAVVGILINSTHTNFREKTNS